MKSDKSVNGRGDRTFPTIHHRHGNRISRQSYIDLTILISFDLAQAQTLLILSAEPTSIWLFNMTLWFSDLFYITRPFMGVFL